MKGRHFCRPNLLICEKTEVPSVGGDAHCQDLIVYKMFGRIVYTPRACKFSSNRIVLSPD